MDLTASLTRELRSGDPGTGGAGIYVHVPFCLRRCHYCDFNTYAGKEALTGTYVAALHADLDRVAAGGPAAVAPPGERVAREWPVFDSVFVGGGTPTLLPAGDLAGIVRRVAERLPLAVGAEISVEANPETVSSDAMCTLVDAGVNRVSIGAQSFVPRVLNALGRWHDVAAPLRAVEECCAAGVQRLSLDLIYGTPVETDADWEHSVRTALASGVGHLSAYALTVEPGTEYARRVTLGTAAAPDDDVQAVRMERVDAWARAAGLERYALSNWARTGEASVHNRVYWRGGDWLGIGAGAHGHWRGRRWWSVRSPERYVKALRSGASPVAGAEILTAAQRRVERLMMGLRLADGVARASVDPLDDRVIAELTAGGLIQPRDDRLVLTSAGMRLASAVTLRLL